MGFAEAGFEDAKQNPTHFTGPSSNTMNDRYTKLDRKPSGDAIEKLPKLDDG